MKRFYLNQCQSDVRKKGNEKLKNKHDWLRTGNPAAEGTSYFFINKISKIKSFTVFLRFN